eukprot:gene8411-9994_t
MEWITSKANLAILGELESLPFLPRTILNQDDVARTLEQRKDINRSVLGKQACHWLAKAPTHRQVIPLCDTPEAVAEHISKAIADGSIVQEMVDSPLLIDHTKFDLGVYVFVTGMGGRRMEVHVFDDFLLRFCLEEFRGDLGMDTAAGNVVGSKYRAAWEMPSLQPWYNTSEAELHSGGATKRALEAYLTANTGDAHIFTQIWNRLTDIIQNTLLSTQPFIKKALEQYSAEHRNNFFELLRFDFVLDTGLKPWLIEVNASPNLYPKSTPQAALLRRLCRGVGDLLLMPRTPDLLNVAEPHAASAHEIGVPTPFSSRALITHPASSSSTMTPSATGFRRLEMSISLAEHQDCVVSDWTEWSACTKACGVGTEHRTRAIVEPQHGTNRQPCPTLYEDMASELDVPSEGLVIASWSAQDAGTNPNAQSLINASFAVYDRSECCAGQVAEMLETLQTPGALQLSAILGPVDDVCVTQSTLTPTPTATAVPSLPATDHSSADTIMPTGYLQCATLAAVHVAWSMMLEA